MGTLGDTGLNKCEGLQGDQSLVDNTVLDHIGGRALKAIILRSHLDLARG